MNFNPDINSDEITKKCNIKTSRNTDKNYIKILNAEDSEKVGTSKNSKKKIISVQIRYQRKEN